MVLFSYVLFSVLCILSFYVASGIVVSHFGSEFNQTTTNKRSLPLLLSQAHVEWTIRRTDLGATLAGQHSKLKVIRVYVLSFLNVRVYFLSSLSSHVQVLSFLSFLNFLRPKVTDHDHSRSPHGHWRWYGHSAIFLQDMHIVVKQVSTNDTTIVYVEASDTIAAVKAKIQDTVGHPVYQQRLGLDPKDELWTSWGERRLIWGGARVAGRAYSLALRHSKRDRALFVSSPHLDQNGFAGIGQASS
jgi:hypothetical protein